MIGLKRIATPLVAVGAMIGLMGFAATTEQQQRGGDLPWMDRVSYSIGYDLALQTMEGLALDQVDANKEMILRGFTDALMAREGVLTAREVDGVLRRFQEQLSNAEVETRLANDPVFKALHDDNLKKSREFLTRFAAQEGAKRLDSGVVYLVEREGAGASPTANDTVVLNFRGVLRDGTEFASGRGGEIDIATLLEGAQSVLTNMKVGSKWVVAIPPDKAFGASGRAPLVGPNEVLLFEVELLSIQSD